MINRVCILLLCVFALSAYAEKHTITIRNHTERPVTVMVLINEGLATLPSLGQCFVVGSYRMKKMSVSLQGKSGVFDFMVFENRDSEKETLRTPICEVSALPKANQPLFKTYDLNNVSMRYRNCKISKSKSLVTVY